MKLSIMLIAETFYSVIIFFNQVIKIGFINLVFYTELPYKKSNNRLYRHG
jgi:hypothetical protein